MSGTDDMIDANIEATALSGNSAEANAIKLEGNTFNIGGGSESTPWIVRMTKGFKRLKDPEEFERAEGRARLARAEADMDIYEMVQSRNPQLTPAQVVMDAHGYRLFPGQAENVAAIIEQVADATPDGNAAALPPAFKETLVRDGAEAYDDEVRELFAKMALGEMERQGSFSKRTMDTLSTLDKETLDLFGRLCSMSFGPTGSEKYPTALPSPAPFLVIDESKTSYNEGRISVLDLRELERAGLIHTDLTRMIPIPLIVGIDGKPYVIAQQGGTEPEKIELKYAILTKVGGELGRLYETGNADWFVGFANEQLDSRGIALRGLLEAASAKEESGDSQ